MYIPRIWDTTIERILTTIYIIYTISPDLLTSSCLKSELRVHTEAHGSQSGFHDLVHLEFSNGQQMIVRGKDDGRNLEMLMYIKFVKPFDQISKVSSSGWCKELRFLGLYYFLEKGTTEKITFSTDGLEGLRRAYASIAKERTSTE
jgi:hypothetical protein